MAWSIKWKSSIKPRKQRAYVYRAPLHLKRKFMSAHLSKDLKGKHKITSIPVRTGDRVTVLRGQFRKKTGKIDSLNVKKSRIFISGIERVKKDGSKSAYPIHPSNVIITELDTSDKRRLEKK